MKLAIAPFIVQALPIVQGLPQNSHQDSTFRWGNCGDSKDELLVEINDFPLPLKYANLPVPLDYADPESGKLDLDLMRIKAIMEPFQGSILFNPGGPGHSGVDFITISSARLHAVLGGHYNLIGFDTRGTGKTLPFACNVSAAPESAASSTSSLATRDIIKHNLTEYLFSGGWEIVELFAEQCARDMADTGSLISTAFVARDIVQIIDALSEDGLLRYWGMSYRTMLGATFAAMFPERVEPVLLDAVANLQEYTAGPWMDSIFDIEKTYRGFLSECIVSCDKCALAKYAGSNATAENLAQIINDALQEIDDPLIEPKSVMLSATGNSGKVTTYNVKFSLQL